MEKQAKKFLKSAKSSFSKAKRTYVCRSLKELIRAYRACTTRSEERALVKKEAAHIRDLFREGDKTFLRQNIAKLLFFHMNGYPTDFGMTECIKLCASPKYSDKRVAYLGLMILVDETEDILTLMTNCLQKDLRSDDIQIVALALNVLGDIANVEMVRDLLPEIENHLKSTDYFIRKKAALTAVRAVRKLSSDETSGVLEMVPCVFEGRDSALHITGAALISALCKQNSQNAVNLQPPMTPILMEILHNHLLSKKEQTASGSRADTVIGTVRNPFLQTKIISAIRLLQENGDSSMYIEELSNLLAQVASNIDGSKVAGCAVLYECVRTIVALPTGKDLRAVAVSILGKFLTHKEPTVRSIALQELTRVVDADGSEILHNIENFKEKIIAGLHEPDSTVRKRAVQLVYQITNGSNIEEMVKELLDYIEKSTSPTAIEDGCWKIFLLADKFAPSDEFKVLTCIKALSLADCLMPEDLITLFIATVSTNQQVQPIAVFSLFKEICSERTASEQNENDMFDGNQVSNENHSTDKVKVVKKPRLERVALYILGEYGQYSESVGLSIPQVLDLFERCLIASEVREETWMDPNSHLQSDENRILGEVALTGLVKFYCRACSGSSGTDTNSNSLLLEQGQTDASSALNSILALPAPSNHTETDTAGLGTDLLASMGLGDEPSAKTERAMVPVSNALTELNTTQSNSLIAIDSDSIGLDGMNPVAVRVIRILQTRVNSRNTELQQRACEYLTMLNEAPNMLASVLAPMPRFDVESIHEKAKQHQSLKATSKKTENNLLLLDLMEEPTSVPSQPPALPMIEDLLALPSTEPDHSLTTDNSVKANGKNPVLAISGTDNVLSDQLGSLDLYDSEKQESPDLHQLTEETSEIITNGPIHTTTVFESDELHVEAQFFKESNITPDETRVELRFRNKTTVQMEGFTFLLAVPKYIKLQMNPASAGEISPGDEISQTVGLKNELHDQKPILLRFRVNYTNAGSDQVTQHQGTVGGLEML